MRAIVLVALVLVLIFAAVVSADKTEKLRIGVKVR